MTVDGEGPYTGTAMGTFQGMDLVQPLYIGSVPDFRTINKAVGQSTGLVGAYRTNWFYVLEQLCIGFHLSVKVA